MIGNSFPLILEVIIFLIVGIPLAAALLAFSFVVAGVAEGAASRPGRRRVLRWQRTLLKGRYCIGGRPRSAAMQGTQRVILWSLRAIVILSLILWVIRIITRLL